MTDTAPLADRAVVVTGASTGIGLACAEALAAKGFHVFASVRKAEDADRLRATLGNTVTPLIFDVTDTAAVRAAAAAVRAALGGRTLAGLVNNAGVAAAGPLLHLPEEEMRKQLDINVLGPFRVVQAFGPLLGTDPSLQGPPGRIVQISSVAGKMGAPFLGAYAASKHALEGMSESLRRELMLYGVDVSVVGPGAVATPIWDKANEIDTSPYEGTDYMPILLKVRDYMVTNGAAGLPPRRIAEAVTHALTADTPKLRYALAPKWFMNWVLPRLLPKRIVDGMIAKRLGMKPRPRG